MTSDIPQNVPDGTNATRQHDPSAAEHTSLESTETTDRSATNAPGGSLSGNDTSDIDFRHSGWSERRNHVLRALNACFPHSDRPDRFERCGKGAWVFEDQLNPGNYTVKADHCHDRWCVPCQRHRSSIIRLNLMSWIPRRKLRFITLTTQNADRPLADGVTHLLRSFARLRKSKLWTSKTAGGVAILEAKRSKRSAQWHPHLHCIVEGTYMSQSALSSTWRAITKDSYIVDIRQVRSSEEVARYVTKYVTKPGSATVYKTHDDLIEAILAMHGRRTLITFGSWYGHNFLAQPDQRGWEPVAPLSELLHRASNGEEYAAKIINQLRGSDPCNEMSVRAPPG